MGWLAGWSYRKTVTITGQAGAGTLYQVDLSIGDSAGGDFHLENHCTSFPNDIQVTDNDGVTVLDYWVEDLTVDPITMWVEVADNLDSNVDIYVYYSKSSESSMSSGTNTFNFFDDFEDALQGDWITKKGAVVYDSADKPYSGSQSMKLGAESSRSARSLTASDDYAIRQWMWVTSLSSEAWTFNWGNGTKLIFTGFSPDGSVKYYDGAWQDTGVDITLQAWNLVEVRNIDFSASTYDIVVNGVVVKTGAVMNTSPSYTNEFWLDGWYLTGVAYVDNHIMRRYNNPEPAFLNAGSEESEAAIMNQFQGANLGADLYDGVLIT